MTLRVALLRARLGAPKLRNGKSQPTKEDSMDLSYTDTLNGRRQAVEPDVTVRNEGTLFLFQPLTNAAKEWIDENVSDEAIWYGRSLVVEHRYAEDVALGMIESGLRVV
jgi:hypothetical protein